MSIEVLLEESPTFDPAPPAGAAFERYLDSLRELHGLS